MTTLGVGAVGVGGREEVEQAEVDPLPPGIAKLCIRIAGPNLARSSMTCCGPSPADCSSDIVRC